MCLSKILDSIVISSGV